MACYSLNAVSEPQNIWSQFQSMNSGAYIGFKNVIVSNPGPKYAHMVVNENVLLL